MPELQKFLEISSARHNHLCPRQVLGVRMALMGATALQINIPQQDKRLLVITETDGCFADGLEVTAGVTVGHRTLRVEDYGKVAATFVDTVSGAAFRLAPRADVRELARDFAPGETRHYFAQLEGYQKMPDEALFSVTPVRLAAPLAQILSRPGVRATCAICGEEIINEREIIFQGLAYCKSCLGQGYYQERSFAIPLPRNVPVGNG